MVYADRFGSSFARASTGMNDATVLAPMIIVKIFVNEKSDRLYAEYRP